MLVMHDRHEMAIYHNLTTKGQNMNDNTTNNINADDLSEVDMEGLFAKAQIVHARVEEVRERLDESVFVGESEDGIFRIGIYGDGRPSSVEVRLNVPAKEKAPFENGVREALEAAYCLRMKALDNGLRAIQDETGVGQDFKVPF